MKNITNLKRKKRKRRIGEYTCLCHAYPFPHRMLGGECEGALFVRQLFDTQMFGSCRDCIFREEADYDSGRGGVTCQVLDGLEPYLACPDLREFVRYESIKLYGNAAAIMRKR